MGFLSRLLGRREPSSREIAKQRLRLTLTYDHIGISPQLLQILKDELITAISKHVPIDREGVKVTFAQGEGCNRLIADIPLLSASRER